MIINFKNIILFIFFNIILASNLYAIDSKAVTAIVFKTLLPRLMGHSSLPVEVVVKMTNLASKYLRIKWGYKNDDFWNVDNHAKYI